MDAIPSRSRVHWMFFFLVLVSIVNVVIITQTGILNGYNTFETDFEMAASESKKNDYTNATATATSSTTKAKVTSKDGMPFKRYEKVVIATKIHGKRQWGLLVQSMCLFHYAYNHKVHYDIVVFTTIDDIPTTWKEELQTSITPVTLTVVVDNRGLQDEIAALPPAKYEVFLERCNVTDPRTLTWESICKDPAFPQASPDLAYNWQAEFRSVRIWEQPALAPYQYMLWLDADGFPTHEWHQDPIGYFIEHQGVILFDHFLSPRHRGYAPKILDSFQATVCNLHVNQTAGHLQGTHIEQHDYDRILAKTHPTLDIADCEVLPVIHGFMHITDLDFYRQPKVLNGLTTLFGHCFLCRIPDDQMAVTLPAAIYAPDKAWDLRTKGFDLRIFHNFRMDGAVPLQPPGFRRHWSEVAAMGFPTADQVCRITEAG